MMVLDATIVNVELPSIQRDLHFSQERADQAKAMSMYAFVSAGVGSIGLLAGGALTQSLDWHWIFFVNVPIGALAFLPLTFCIAVLSMGVTARAIERFGPVATLAAGLSGIIAGLLLLSTSGVHASYFPDLFFAFLLLGLGAGASFLPLLTIGMSDAPARDAGLASGIINVSVQLFGAIGLATLGMIATDHTKTLSAQGYSLGSALTGGYQLSYIVGAAAVAVGILAALLLLRTPPGALRQETRADAEVPGVAEFAAQPA